MDLHLIPHALSCTKALETSAEKLATVSPGSSAQRCEKVCVPISCPGQEAISRARLAPK